MSNTNTREITAWLMEYTRSNFQSQWDGANTSLADLGIDSLTGVDLICALERRFAVSIPADLLTLISTSDDLVDALATMREHRQGDVAEASLYQSFVNPWLAGKLQQLKIDRSFVRAHGPFLYDEDGVQYLDFLAQYGAVPFGHHPDEIWQAVKALHDDGEPVFAQPSLLPAAGRLAARLIELAPAGLRYVTFTNSGAECVEAALKMARLATGRPRILATHNAFHGKTFGALSATGKPDYQTHFGLPLAGFDHIEYGDAARLDEHLTALAQQYAAFIVEPIQGEGGVCVPPKGYLAQVEAICRRHGVVLIVDEVQTGLGRTGAMFACDYEGVRPDILLLSKALGGGLVPVGAVLCSEAVYREKFALKHSSTFAGNALAARVGLATIERLARNQGELLQQIREQGAYLKQGLEALRERYPLLIEEIRGRGLMVGIRFNSDRSGWPENFLGIAAQEGELAQFVASYLLNVERIRFAPTLNRGDVLRVQPPLTVTREQCDMAVEALDRTLRVLSTRDTGLFYRALLRREAPSTQAVETVNAALERTSTAAVKASPHMSVPPDTHRFAFLLHPLDAQSYADYDISLRGLDAEELAEFEQSMDGMVDPVVGSTVDIRSATGAHARGDFIMISHTAAQLRRLSQRDAVTALQQAVALAHARGAQIVGLGAYTSVVSGGGAQLLNSEVPLTSGNSYTVAAGIEALDDAIVRIGQRWDTRTAAVVGAAGAIGACMAVLLSRRAQRIILVGNPAHTRIIGRARLLRTARMIIEDALAAPFGAAHEGSVAAHIVNAVRGSRPANADSLIAQMEADGVLVLSADISSLRGANVVLAATSFPGEVVPADALSSGAVVCDISRPRSIPASLAEGRDDILVIDGGIIALPGAPRIGPYGIAPGTSYACMAETILLALEGRFENVSIGSTLSIEEIARQQELARKHGFSLAGLQSFGRPLADSVLQRYMQCTREPAFDSTVELA